MQLIKHKLKKLIKNKTNITEKKSVNKTIWFITSSGIGKEERKKPT